jgi:hypothetical protein
MNSPRMVRTMLPVAERAALACNAAYPLPRPSLGTEVGPTKGSPLGSKSFPSARGRAEPLLKSVPSPSIADAMQGIVTDSSSLTSVFRPTLPGAGASPSVARRSYAQQRMRCGRPPLRIGTAARVDPIELQHARNNLGATIRGSDQQARSCSIGCLRTRTAEVASRRDAVRPRRGRRRMDPKSAASTRKTSGKWRFEERHHLAPPELPPDDDLLGRINAVDLEHSLLWWKVLEERKKFSISTTTNTARLAVSCAAPDGQCSFGDTPS